MAKDFGVKTLIAVVRNPEHKELFERIGVKIIIPDDVVAEHLYQKLYMVEDFLFLGERKAEIFLVKVENSKGKNLGKLNLPNGCSVIGVYRNGLLYCPPVKDTALQPGDELLVYTTKPENIKKAVEVFRKINGV
jgi:trk system potassium uptake protein TrkA